MSNHTSPVLTSRRRLACRFHGPDDLAETGMTTYTAGLVSIESANAAGKGGQFIGAPEFQYDGYTDYDDGGSDAQLVICRSSGTLDGYCGLVIAEYQGSRGNGTVGWRMTDHAAWVAAPEPEVGA